MFGEGCVPSAVWRYRNCSRDGHRALRAISRATGSAEGAALPVACECGRVCRLRAVLKLGMRCASHDAPRSVCQRQRFWLPIRRLRHSVFRSVRGAKPGASAGKYVRFCTTCPLGLVPYGHVVRNQAYPGCQGVPMPPSPWHRNANPGTHRNAGGPDVARDSASEQSGCANAPVPVARQVACDFRDGAASALPAHERCATQAANP